MAFIVITGSPVAGFDYIGPFEDSEDAVEFGETSLVGEWWLGHLDSPPEPETEPMTLNEGIAALRRLAQRYGVQP